MFCQQCLTSIGRPQSPLYGTYREELPIFQTLVFLSAFSQVDAFFKRHYGPQSLTVTIVGDVDPAQASACAVAAQQMEPHSGLQSHGNPVSVHLTGGGLARVATT